MTLDELQAQAEKDLSIDDTELDLESLKTPQLHSQYLKTYSTYALMMKKAEGDYSKLHIKKWLFFTGKADPQEYKDKNFDLKVLRQDVDKFIDADDEIIKSKLVSLYTCGSALPVKNNHLFKCNCE